LRRKPPGKENSRRSIAGRKVDSQLVDLSKIVMRGRMIEELREREADIVQARPI
jgi:hypothetical protein